jgi:RNA polymerase sigma-70 factor (ECF subfamily)
MALRPEIPPAPAGAASPATAPAGDAATVAIEHGLALRARAGDRAAFRVIFDRCAPGVRRFLGDLLRDDAAADEATQETFVRAYRHLADLREAERLASWLFGIARHVAHEQLRVRRRRERGAEEALADLPDRAPGPEGLLLGAESEQLLADALGRLSEDRRAALVLRLDHGLGYEAIAAALSWSLPKVKNEIHRARLELRARLAPHVGGEP